MNDSIEVSNKELREVYKLLSKEELIEALINKREECRNYMKKSFAEGVNRGCYIASLIQGKPINRFDNWNEYFKGQK